LLVSDSMGCFPFLVCDLFLRNSHSGKGLVRLEAFGSFGFDVGWWRFRE
jgi:hypothetical protein